jgi:hypothetical protein
MEDLNDFYYFDFEKENWVELKFKNVPSPRYGHNFLIENNEKLYIFGKKNIYF